MAEIFPRDILLRVGGRTMARHGVWAVAGARRGLVDVPITFTRADASTCAFGTDRDGFLRLAAAGVPRPAWVDLDGDGILETLAMRLEGARTSGWDQYNNLNGSNWTKENVTVTVDATTAPDGSSTADKIVEDATVGVGHGMARNTPALTDNTLSPPFIYAKAGERTWLRVRSTDKSNTVRDSWVNLATGTAGTTNAGHTLVITAAKPAGWYKVVCRFNAASGGTTPSLRWALATGDANITYTGDGTSGLYLWGADFQANQPFESSLIGNANSATTRAADSCKIPHNFGPVDYTVLARFARPVHADVAGTLAGFRIADLSGAVARTRLLLASNTRDAQGAIDTSGTDASVTAAIPAGASLAFTWQVKNLLTGGQIAVGVGSGLGGFSAAASAIANFGDQTLYIGSGSDGLEFFGDLVDLLFVRGLQAPTDMLALA